MTKQEKIQEAWNTTKIGHIDGFNKDGSIHHSKLSIDQLQKFNNDEFISVNGYITPKSILGIKTNNGWTKIESAEDLPERVSEYNVIAFDGRIYGAWLTSDGRWLNNKHNDLSRLTNVTHWRPIIEIPKPIY